MSQESVETQSHRSLILVTATLQFCKDEHKTVLEEEREKIKQETRTVESRSDDVMESLDSKDPNTNKSLSFLTKWMAYATVRCYDKLRPQC
jgi:hypothetical protein